MNKPVNWSQTYTGLAFDYDNMENHEFSPLDFSHSLALLCRYNGHCTRFYSVAEHLVRCSFVAPPEFAFEALMHDVSEAYLSDMPRPLKAMMPEYKALEKRVEEAICRKYKLPFPMSPEVKEIDNRMLLTEKDLIMCPPPYEWDTYGLKPYSYAGFSRAEDVYPQLGWDWQSAEKAFLDRFKTLYSDYKNDATI